MSKKFLNVFLKGALSLCALGFFSSCKDYDDDISNLSDRIDDLETVTVSISSLESQISSINSTISSLQTDLKSQISALGDDLDGIETDIDNLVASLENYVSNEELQSTVNTLKELYYTKSELDEMYADIAAADVETSLDALREVLGSTGNDWFGGDFEEYVAALGFINDVESLDALLGNSESINAVNEAIEDYYEELLGLMTDSEGNQLSTSDLQTNLTALQDQVAAIETRLAEVEGRIQSLVYAPATVDGVIYFSGEQSVTMKDSKSVEKAVILRSAETAAPSTATFYVSPKSLADSLCTDTWTLSVVQYEATKATDTYVKIDGVSSDPAEGTITVKLASTYSFEDGDKTLMIALHAEKEGAEGAKYGASYTTEFIEIAFEEESDVTDNFVFGYEEDGAYYASETALAGDVVYTSKDVMTFFSDHDYQIVYSGNDGIMSLADAAEKYNWDITLEEGSEAEGISLSAGATAENYSLSEDYTSFSLAEHLTSMIGNTVTGSYSFYATDGEYYLTVDATDVRTITDDSIVGVAGSSSFSWNYETATGDQVYDAADYSELTGLSAANYNILKSADLSSCVTVYEGNVTLDSSELVEAAFTASVEFNTNPKVDTDLMTSRIILSGDISKGGAYTAVVKYSDADDHSIIVYIPVSVTGAPATAEINLGTIDLTYVLNQTEYELAPAPTEEDEVNEYISLAWAKLSTSEQAQYGSIDNFIAAIAAATETVVEDEDKAQYIYYSSDAFYAHLDASSELDTSYSVETDYVSSWGTIVKYTAKVKISTSALAKLTIGDAVGTGNTVVVESKISGSSSYALDFDKHDLSKVVAWYAGSETGYEVKYEITSTHDDEEKTPVTEATISGSVLDWGTWTGLELEVTATLTYGDIVCDTQVFTFKLNNPISGELVFNGGKGAVSVTAGSSDVTVDIFDYLSAEAEAKAEADAEASGEAVDIADYKTVLLDGLVCTCEDFKGEHVFAYSESGSNPREMFAQALGAELTYGDVTTSVATQRISFANGVLTVAGNNAQIASPITVTIPVTYKDRFNEYETNIEFVVSSSVAE